METAAKSPKRGCPLFSRGGRAGRERDLASNTGEEQDVARQMPDQSGGGSSHSTMRDALLTEPCKALMPDSRAPVDDPQGSDFRRSVTSVSEEPATPAAVEEFLQALPAITHELSEALTAVSAYLTGSRHLFEHGNRFDKIQSAIEQADLQARRANDTLRLLRESFGQVRANLTTRSTVWVDHSGKIRS
jgi:hypothetical protein